MPCDLNNEGYHVGDSFLVLVVPGDSSSMHYCSLPKDHEFFFRLGVTCIFIIFVPILIVIGIVVCKSAPFYRRNFYNYCFSYFYDGEPMIVENPDDDNNNYDDDDGRNQEHVQLVPRLSVSMYP